MKNRRAYTVIEVLVCIGITSITIATMAPVFSKAKHRAKITKSLSNLRQMFVACELYRMDHDGVGQFGDLPEMGLPRVEFVFRDRFGLPLDLFSSPCGDHPSDNPRVIDYYYNPGFGGPDFAREAILYGSNGRLFTDLNCTDHTVSLYNPFRKRRGLGVLMEGQLVNRFKEGDMDDPSWWGPPQN